MNATRHAFAQWFRRAEWLGVLIALGAIGALEITTRTLTAIASPSAIYLTAIVFASFLGGWRTGVVSAGLILLHAIFFLSDPNTRFMYAPDDATRLLMLSVSAPIIVALVGALKKRAESVAATDRVNAVLHAQLAAAAERERLLLETQVSKQQIENILVNMSDGFVAFDAQMNYTYVNARGAEWLGRKPADLIGKNYWTEFPEAKGTPFANAYVRALEMQTPISFENHYAPWDRWFENRIYPSPDGLAIFFSDVTERKRAETELRRKNRALATISNSNQALLRAQDETALLNEICRICVETGGYRMAWIGYAEHDAAQSVRPVAQCGFEDGYLDAVNISWADTERGRGPTGTAIRTSQVCLARNIPGDPSYAPWRAAAIQRGYASSIALPLNADGVALGALCIYAAAPDAFDVAEVALLTELAGDLAFGIATLRARAEHARAEAHIRFQADLLANVNDAILATDPNQIVIYWNRAAEKMYGWQAADAIGKPGREVARSEFTDAQRAAAIQALRDAGNYRVEVQQFRRDGQAFWVEGNTIALHDPSGKLTGFISVNRDMTERERAELALRESQNQLALVIHSANVGLWDWDLTSNKVAYSPEWKSQLGCADHEISNDFAEWSSRVHPDDLARASQTVSAYLEKPYPNFQNEFRMRHKDGSYRWILAQASLLFDAQGKPLRMMGSHIDITTRKQAEEQLRLSEERFASAFHTSPAGITITRIADGKFVDANAAFCKMFEYNRAEVVGHTSTELNMWTPPERQKIIDEQIRTGGLHNFELEAHAKFGRTITILFSSKPMELRGEPHHITTMIDITERKIAEEKLRESEQRFSRIFHASPSAIALARVSDQRFVDTNDAFLDTFGYTRNEVIGHTSAELQLWANPQERAPSVQQFREHGFLRSIEWRYRRKSGATGIALTSAEFIEVNGEAHVLTQFTDVTERKIAEEALRESERFNRFLFETSPIGLALCRMDGALVDVNQAYAKIIGRSVEETLALTYWDITPRKYAEQEQQQLESLQRTGRYGPFEKEYRHKDGHLVNVQLSGVILERQGESYIWSTVEDITERKQAEAERQKFVLLADSSSEFIGMCDLDLQPLYVNPAGVRMVGLPDMAAACRVKVQDYFFPEDQPFITAEFFPRVLREGHGDVEIRLRHFQTGEPIWMFYYLFAIRDASGATIGWATVSRDITERKRAEEKLRESEALFSKVFRSSPIGINIFRMSDGRSHVVNDAFLKIIGYSRQDVEQHSAAELNLFVDTNARNLWMQKLRAGGEVSNQDARIRTQSGEIRDTLASLSVVEINGERMILVIVTDITERKRAEEKLRESEERYRLLFHRSPVGVVEYDVNLIVTDCNERFVEILHTTRERVLGLNMRNLRDHGAMPQFEKSLQGQEGYAENIYQATTSDVRRWLITRTAPVFDAAGKVRGGVATIEDIHERKLAEEEVRRRAQHLMLLNDITRAAIESRDLHAMLQTLADRLGELLAADGCYVTLWDEAQQRTAPAAAFGDFRETFPRLLPEPGESTMTESVLRAGHALVAEDVFNTPYLSARIAAQFSARSLLGLPLIVGEQKLGAALIEFNQPHHFTADEIARGEQAAGQIALAIAKAQLFAQVQSYAGELEQRVVARTAELQVAMEKAQSADRLKSAFLATMSHELRTPLNSIIGFTGILLQGLAGTLNAEQTKQMTMVRDSAQHLLALINDVLDLSKIEAGQFEIRREPFELRALLERVSRTLAPLAEKKGLAFTVHLAPEIPTLVSDRRRVEQVLINLINNAIKFTEHGEVVLEVGSASPTSTLRVQPPRFASNLYFSVRDTGIGIAAADLDALFQPFRQIDTGLARRHEGTGLGLAICKRLAELLGGTIGVESELGVGSTFTFVLPAQVWRQG